MDKAYFFTHYNGDPYYNMAFDEWMFAQAVSRPENFYLRLYSWSEGAVTFGYNQNEKTALDFNHIGSTPAIRRITGGRALYHDPSELTYSIAVQTNNIFFNKSVPETVETISQILVLFLEQLGIKSHYMRTSSSLNSNPSFFHKAPCFESHSRSEIVSAGEKIIASAQRRHKNTLFQHGAIKINGLKSHPAVALRNYKELPDSQIVMTLNEFETFAEIFKTVFEKELNLILHNGFLNSNNKSDIELCLDEVQKNCLNRRDIIKQK